MREGQARLVHAVRYLEVASAEIGIYHEDELEETEPELGDSEDGSEPSELGGEGAD